MHGRMPQMPFAFKFEFQVPLSALSLVSRLYYSALKSKITIYLYFSYLVSHLKRS